VFFLFATELATEMGFTDDCYTDGRVPSVSPSVCFSPTDFIVVTDGMSPSVKLDNVVVIWVKLAIKHCTIRSLLVYEYVLNQSLHDWLETCILVCQGCVCVDMLLQ
jgi:hypothetical protein